MCSGVCPARDRARVHLPLTCTTMKRPAALRASFLVRPWPARSLTNKRGAISLEERQRPRLFNNDEGNRTAMAMSVDWMGKLWIAQVVLGREASAVQRMHKRRRNCTRQKWLAAAAAQRQGSEEQKNGRRADRRACTRFASRLRSAHRPCCLLLVLPLLLFAAFLHVRVVRGTAAASVNCPITPLDRAACTSQIAASRIQHNSMG